MTSTQVSFTLKTEISQSLRANQVCSMFDAPVAETCERGFDIEFPWNEQPWNVGVVVGPSGSGKSSVLRHVWGESPALRWDAAGLVDDFPESATTEEISSALSSVGFSTVPAWLRPHRVLSVGEQFRADVARRLMSDADPVVVDEFTSVVNRQVAQVASHAIQRHVRANKRRFVAVGCHYDVIDWLQPDWVLDMATQTFTRRLLQRRPTVRCAIGRLPRTAWSLFSPFHYMSADLPKSCHGFGLWANGTLACSLWLAVFPHPKAKDIIRVARVVTLPDYQGLGLAFRLLETLGAALGAAGKRLRNYPAHPAFIAQHETNSASWRKVKDQSFGPENGRGTNEGGRYCAVFEFSGQPNARFATALGVMRGLRDSNTEPSAAEPSCLPVAVPIPESFDTTRDCLRLTIENFTMRESLENLAAEIADARAKYGQIDNANIIRIAPLSHPLNKIWLRPLIDLLRAEQTHDATVTCSKQTQVRRCALVIELKFLGLSG